MKISFKEDDNQLTYIISDCEKYKSIIESQFYTNHGEYFTKNFSKAENYDVEKLKNNFITYAEEMFMQMGYLKEVLWEKGLIKFINIIEDKGIDWWLTGSCALCLRGIDIKPHDIDIMLDSKDINKIRAIFEEYIVEPILSCKGWVVDYFGVLFMETRIDLAFDPQEFADNPNPTDFGQYAKNKLEEIIWMGKKVKIPPLDLQLEANRRRGRNDRVRAIEVFMQENN